MDPRVLSTRSFDGRPFVRLARGDTTLTHFFTGRRAKVHPLKDTTTFADLVSLRNRATVDSRHGVGDVEVEDLGLDVEHVGAIRRERRARPPSKIPQHVVSVEVDGTSVRVLSGHGNLDVYMEATSDNMDLLYKRIRSELAELDAVAAAAGPLAAEPSGDMQVPPAPSTPSTSSCGRGLFEEDESPVKTSMALTVADGVQDSREFVTAACAIAQRADPSPVGSSEGDIADDDHDVDQLWAPVRPRQSMVQIGVSVERGLTWNEARKAWLLRYKDSDGVKHQKRFRAGQDAMEASSQDAKRRAQVWLAEYKERGTTS